MHTFVDLYRLDGGMGHYAHNSATEKLVAGGEPGLISAYPERPNKDSAYLESGGASRRCIGSALMGPWRSHT